MFYKSWFVKFCMCILGILFFSGCGLDEFYILEAPSAEPHSNYSSSKGMTDDFTEWYFELKTNDIKNKDYWASEKANFVYLGTEVLYRIYNNYNTIASHEGVIDSINTDDNYGAAASKLIDTYGYKPLKMQPDIDWSPFIPESGKNQTVIFRLKTYQDSIAPELKAHIKIDNKYLGYDSSTNKIKKYMYNDSNGTWIDEENQNVDFNSIHFIIPYRTDGSHSFDFFDYNDTKSEVNIEPKSGDEDFEFSSSASDDDAYYVKLYAVSKGRDANYTNSYSLVVDLGTVPIKRSE